MSYNLSIKAPRVIEVYDGNLTWNISEMLQVAFEHEDHIKKLNGMKCVDAKPIVQKAYVRLLLNEENYEQYNAPNGWGTYEDTVEYIGEFYQAILNNLDGRVFIE